MEHRPAKARVAVVVPLIRTPMGVDFFDFAIPSGLELSTGDLVQIPFRKGTLFGLVWGLKEKSEFNNLKSILEILPIQFPEPTLRLMQAVSARTFTSLPTILKAWLRAIPKRWNQQLLKTDIIKRTNKLNKEIQALWVTDMKTEIKTRISDALKQQKQVLFICPWKDRIEWWKSQFPSAHILTSDTTDTEYFKSWSQFLKQETSLIITTRIGAWLTSGADIIILDEPENDDHKQDELAPRYDARWIVRWCFDRIETLSVQAIGLTPPLHTQGLPPTIPVDLTTVIYHPQGYTAIPMIQHESLDSLVNHEGPKYIIHPIKGSRSSIACNECGWVATCSNCHGILKPEGSHARCKTCGRQFDIPLSCAECGSARLERGLPGIDTLKSKWQKHQADIEVEWRDVSNESIEREFKPNACVVITLPKLLAGSSEDIRRRERLFIAYRRIANNISQAGGKLVLQTTEEETGQWHDWLNQTNAQTWIENEKRTRSVFKYPPTYLRVKILIEGGETKAAQWLKGAKVALPQLQWEGPFPTEQSSARRRTRQAIHAVCDHSITEDQLIAWLTPFAKEAIIDLDPIAFLR